MNLHRIIQEIYTIRDPREKEERPLAADIFLGFWRHHLGKRIESLKSLYFVNIRERTLNDMRANIYGLMRQSRSRDLEIQRETSTFDEKAAFDMIYRFAKFGICARTMVEENRKMRDFGTQIKRFEFLPKDRGRHYDFKVVFEQTLPRHN